MKISVCIPTYNNPSALKRCIDSVLKQSYKNIEVIITDDSTNMETSSLLKQYNDQRVHYYHNAVPLGSPANWNYAMLKAKGEYIKIMHHDDWFRIDRALEIFLEAAIADEHSDTLWICHGFTYSSQGKNKFGAKLRFIKKLQKDPCQILYTNYIGDPSMTFFKRSLLQQFDEKSRWLVDALFYLNFLISGTAAIKVLNLPLVNVTSGSHLQVTAKVSGIEKIEELLYSLKTYTSKDEFRKTRFYVQLKELQLRHNLHPSQVKVCCDKFDVILPGTFFSLPDLPYKIYSLCRRLNTWL